MRFGSLLAIGSSVIICGLAGAAGSADAAKTSKRAAPPQEPVMKVQRVRSAQDGCEPDCLEWIAAQGRIEGGAAAQFRKVLKKLGKRKLPVLIHSGGGRDDEGMAIGRLLRAQGIDVAVARTTLAACKPKDAACRKKPARGRVEAGFAFCASSCAFILAGGSRRFVGGASLVGVHRAVLLESKVLRTYQGIPYRTRNGGIAYRKKLVKTKVLSRRQRQAPAKVYAKYERYFSQMGVGKQIMPLMLKTPHSSIHWLAHEELRETRMATHRMDAEQLLLGDAAADDGWTITATTEAAPEPAPPAPECEHFAGTGFGCMLPQMLEPGADPAADVFANPEPSPALSP